MRSQVFDLSASLRMANAEVNRTLSWREKSEAVVMLRRNIDRSSGAKPITFDR